MLARSTQNSFVVKERPSFQAKRSGRLSKLFSWWILVMESGYEPEQTSNVTCMKFSRLQVG